MESSLKISNAQDQANGPRVSNKIESSTTIFPCETEPLNSDNVESTPITLDVPPCKTEPLNSYNVESTPKTSDEPTYRK